MEKFVQANTQELAKDKWLCPLSGKKFRGPEFVRKHIFNKHGDKVDEVKTEVRLYVEKKMSFQFILVKSCFWSISKEIPNRKDFNFSLSF